MPALIGAGLLACLAGGGAWYAAAQAAANALDAMIAGEDARGRTWSCPDRRISGFPYALELSCREPSFRGLISGKPMVARAQALRAKVLVFRPDVVVADIEAPVSLRSDDGRTDLSVSWRRLQVVVGTLPEDLSHIAFTGEGLAAQGSAEEFAAPAGQAGRVYAVIGKSADGQDRAYDFHLTAQEVTSPVLAAAFGSEQPLQIKADGTVTEVAFDPAARPAQSLDDWRAGGGDVDFKILSVSQNETQISAHGTLKIDASHRLQGRLDTESVGIEPILRRYGINPSLATAGVLLSGLFAGKTQAVPLPTKSGAINLPVRFENGSVIVGPVQTSLRLPPLY